VFCGSSSGTRPEYGDAARAVGSLLAGRGIDLVYGGGAVGLMGAVADACLESGGRVVGVIPVGLFSREVAHTGVTELHEVGSMHERKQLMYERSDAFLALPGGYGTLEELAEVTTWSQLGLHAKPVALLDVAGFWNPLVHQLDTMVAEGFLKAENRKLVQLTRTPEDALEHLASTEPVMVEKWITPEER
jgi:uncharacterized protein (TIGR00730 family)